MIIWHFFWLACRVAPPLNRPENNPNSVEKWAQIRPHSTHSPFNQIKWRPRTMMRHFLPPPLKWLRQVAPLLDRRRRNCQSKQIIIQQEKKIEIYRGKRWNIKIQQQIGKKITINFIFSPENVNETNWHCRVKWRHRQKIIANPNKYQLNFQSNKILPSKCQMESRGNNNNKNEMKKKKKTTTMNVR